MNAPNSAMVMAYFRYQPNYAVAYVVISLFLLIDIYLIMRIVRQKAPAFMFKMIPLAIMETIGIALRIVCFKTKISLAKFLIMNILMLMPPNVLTLIFYNTISNIIILSKIKSDKWYLSPKKIITVFFGFTILSSMIQAVGGALMLVNNLRETGRRLAISGLSIQSCVFLGLASLLIHIIQENQLHYYIQGVENPKKKVLIRLCTVLFLMIIRIVFRLAQFATGATGIIASREWPLYVFDVLVAAISFLIFSTLNNYFPKRGNSDTTEQGSEIEKTNLEINSV